MLFFIFSYCVNIISQYILIPVIATRLGAPCAHYSLLFVSFKLAEIGFCKKKKKGVQGILLFPLPRPTGSGVCKPRASWSFSEFLACAEPSSERRTVPAAFRERKALKTARGSGALTITALSTIYKYKRRTNKSRHRLSLLRMELSHCVSIVQGMNMAERQT